MLDNWLWGDSLKSKILRFGLVGGASTLFYGLFTLAAVEIARLPPLPATVLGYLLVIPLNFVLQRGFTFRSDSAMTREIPRFLLVHGLNVAASLAAMFVAVDVFHADYRWGIAATMILVPALVFVAMNSWVFRRARH